MRQNLRDDITVMRATHDKCGRVLVNTGELLCVLKSNIKYCPLLPKATIKNHKCNVKPPDPPTWSSRS